MAQTSSKLPLDTVGSCCCTDGKAGLAWLLPRRSLPLPLPSADAAADREALRAWLGLPASAEPAAVLLFCADDGPSLRALPHAHGLLARLQRAWPDAVIQGAASAGFLYYRPSGGPAGCSAPNVLRPGGVQGGGRRGAAAVCVCGPVGQGC